MLTADTTTLAEPDRAYVERLLGLSPALAAARDLAQRFATLVRAHTDDALTPWLADADNSELCGFSAGLRQSHLSREHAGKQQAAGDAQTRSASDKDAWQFKRTVCRDEAPQVQRHAMLRARR